MSEFDERDAFHAAIWQSPDDDLPRLVYADWLDENGHPTEAELIRVQCHLDHRRAPVPEPALRSLFVREQELLRAARFGGWWASAWGDGFAQLGPVFVRGVPERVIVSLSFLLDRGRRLFDTFSTVRELAVYDVRHRGSELAGCELIADLDTLEIADWPSPGDIDCLLRSPHFGGQSTVRLWAHGVANGNPMTFIDPVGWRPRRRVELLMFDDRWATRCYALARATRTVWGPEGCQVVTPSPLTFLANGRGRGRLAFRTGTTAAQKTHYPQPHEPWAQLLAFPAADGVVSILPFAADGTQGRHTYRMVKPPDADLDEWLAERFALEPGPIWIRPFVTQHGHSLRWLPDRLRTALHELTDTPADADADHLGGRIKHWMAGGYAEAWNWRAEPNPSILTPRGDLWPE